MTIMKRVEAVLAAAGEQALAAELRACLESINGNVNKYMGLNKQLQKTMDEYIQTVQTRCVHQHWVLIGTNKISCVTCGLSIEDEKAYAFGKRVVSGTSVPYSYGGGRFSMDMKTRKWLGGELLMKEIRIEDWDR